MRAGHSLIRAWVEGVAAFSVVTAAFCLALSIAISGPPTAEELSGLRVALAAAGAQMERGAQAGGASLCAQFPDLAGCPRTELAAAKSPAPALLDAPAKSEPPPLPPPVAATETPAPGVQAELLGEPRPSIQRRATNVRTSPPPRAARRPARAPRTRQAVLRPPITADVLSSGARSEIREDIHVAPPLEISEPPAPQPTKATDPVYRDDYRRDEEPCEREYDPRDRYYDDDEEPHYDDEPYLEDEYIDERW